MTELKTKKNEADVGAFLDGIENEKRREDCRAVVELMADVTGEPPAMWGRQHHRLRQLPLQVPHRPRGRLDGHRGLAAEAEPDRLHHDGLPARHEELMKKLGRYTTGKSCLYIRKIEGRGHRRAAGARPRVVRARVEGGLRLVTPAFPGFRPRRVEYGWRLVTPAFAGSGPSCVGGSAAGDAGVREFRSAPCGASPGGPARPPSPSAPPGAGGPRCLRRRLLSPNPNRRRTKGPGRCPSDRGRRHGRGRRHPPRR